MENRFFSAICLIPLWVLNSCSARNLLENPAAIQPTPTSLNSTDPESQRLDELKKSVGVLNLQFQLFQDTVKAVSESVSSSFANCASAENVLEKKICVIAQSANADQLATFKNQLATMVSSLQSSLYGPNCIKTDMDLLCPTADSIAGNLAQAKTSIANAEKNIDQLKGSTNALADAVGKLQQADALISAKIEVITNDLKQAQADLSALKLRLNAFDGSDKSIELVIKGINDTITDHAKRISQLETSIDQAKVIQTVEFCSTNSSSGPVFEVGLITGNSSTLFASEKSGMGLSVLAQKGATTSFLWRTNVNTKRCNVLVKTSANGVLGCWHNTDRLASHDEIDKLIGTDFVTCVGGL